MNRLSLKPTLTDKPLPDNCDYLHLDGEKFVDTLIGIRVPTRDENLYKVDSIPYHSSDVHLWDVVRVEWRWAEPPLIVEVVTPSSFKTLRVGWHRLGQGDYVINGPLDPQEGWKVHPIHKEWAALGLATCEPWYWNMRIEGAVFAVPPSYNVAKIELLKRRHPDLCIELV